MAYNVLRVAEVAEGNLGEVKQRLLSAVIRRCLLAVLFG